jgi:hypothetical protein
VCALLNLYIPLTDDNPLYLLLRAGPNFWVVLEGCPTCLTPDRLARLYDFLQREVVAEVVNRQRLPLTHAPAVLHFVNADETALFPNGTEGFAGLTGLARWRCVYAGALVSICALEDKETGSGEIIRVLLVNRADAAEMIGITVHEMTHLFGTVDGSRCPAHEAYCPNADSAPDRSDAYWWYGHVGVFDLRPAGLTQAALTGACATSNDPALCKQLAALLPLEAVGLMAEVRAQGAAPWQKVSWFAAAGCR